MSEIHNLTFKSSLKTFFLIVIISVCVRAVFMPDNPFKWDCFGYYLYLPATFIYHDLKLEDKVWIDRVFATYNPSDELYQVNNTGNNKNVILYTVGNAVLYAPFFFAAHIVAAPLGFQADGFSVPYQRIISVCGLIYALLGLWYLRKVLLVYFSDSIASLTMLIVFLGTNYMSLNLVEGTLLSHNFLFTFYAVLLWNTIQWHKEPKLVNALGIGLSVGIIVLLRPVEIVCILIPVLWNIYDRKSVISKFHQVKSYVLHIISAGLLAIAICSLQLIYWYYVTGDFFVYAYDLPYVGFDFRNPHIFDLLFSFRKGWLIYTPVMFFALAGFTVLLRHKRALVLALGLFLLTDIYLMSSWTQWWYPGGSFSSRTMVPAYAALSLPMGFFINYVMQLRIVQKTLIVFCIIVFTLMNLFQSWQFNQGILSPELMTKEYYFAAFGKTKFDPENEKLLLVNRSYSNVDETPNRDRYTKSTVVQFDFEQPLFHHNIRHSGTGSFRLDSLQFYSSGLDIAYSDLTKSDHAWLRSTVYVYLTDSSDLQSTQIVCALHHSGKPYRYRSLSLPAEGIKLNEWNKVQMNYVTPEIRNKADRLKIYVWYSGKNTIFIDDLLIDKFTIEAK